MTKLDQLAAMSTVVADTGDIDAIAQLKPVDATTNPSLLLKAAGLERFAEDVSALKGSQNAADEFAVRVGSQIVQLVPGSSVRKSMLGCHLILTRPLQKPRA